MKTNKDLTKIQIQLPNGYAQLLAELKTRVSSARLRAALAANKELVELYLDIGHVISERQKTETWGAKVIKKLAEDLKKSFPGHERFFGPQFVIYEAGGF